MLLSAITLLGCTASAEPTIMTDEKSHSCTLALDFSKDTEISQWWTLLDGVMGGRSSGVRFAEDNHMVFQGRLNTNGGGFSSIRRSLKPGDMAGAQTLRLRVKQDDRDYKLTFRTSERFRGRSVSYQRAIPSSRSGDWEDITIPLENFTTSIFGRYVPAAELDPTDIREMGIMLADGIDGDFRLEVAEIVCG